MDGYTDPIREFVYILHRTVYILRMNGEKCKKKKVKNLIFLPLSRLDSGYIRAKTLASARSRNGRSL